MSFLEKIQKLPERKRKIILWLIVIIIGLPLFVFWAKNLQQKLKSFEKEKLEEEFQLPSLQEKLKEIPKIEIPEMEIPEISEEEWQKMKEGLTEEEIRELEEILKKTQQ